MTFFKDCPTLERLRETWFEHQGANGMKGIEATFRLSPTLRADFERECATLSTCSMSGKFTHLMGWPIIFDPSVPDGEIAMVKV